MSLVYQPAAMRFRTVPVLTNTVPVGAQRGPGENQFVSVIEPMMDQAARQLNMDRFDLRIINAPDSNAKFGENQGPVTSAFLKDALAQLRKFSNWDERKKRSGQKNGTKVTGIGIGQGYHSAGSNGFDGLLRFTPDGKLHVHTGVGNLGTHSWASTARVAPDLLNVSWDNVVIERGDTRRGLPFNSPQAGSLTASTESRTMYAAAMDMKDKLTDIAAQMLGGKPEDYVLGDEKVVAKAGGKSITYQQAAQKAVELGGKYSGKEVPDELNPVTKSAVAMIAGSGLVAAVKDKLPRVGTTPGLTCNVAEVEIDTETGVVEVKECMSVVDVGTVLFPLGLGHQIASGQILGIGMAHLERHLYDPKLGIPAAVGFHQGKVPTYLDIPPNITWQAVEKPDPQHPLGIKGVGEPSLGSGASAITSAIADALGGHLFNRTPVTADMILNHLSGRPPAHKPLQVNTV
jgi:CO/xanthine dehydrogenase Mo-binding subunit